MSERSAAEQERDIKDALRRASRTTDKKGTLRRDTLLRLINLIHSPYPALKILAAGNIRHFFTDFPDLEETAINAVYDLCEDQSSKVRIEGYTAITHISRADNKWIKQNADVLLQLLQSDEPDEVLVVKKALSEHLDMDPKITLAVLCDQILPADTSMDEEEKAVRDRLRSLVLSFLTGKAKRAIVERHATPGTDAEKILINGLLEAIFNLENPDIEIIVKELLLSLECFKKSSPWGQSLTQTLLKKVAKSLRADMHSQSRTLVTTRPYLELVYFLVNEKRVVQPTSLLEFYCTQLIGRITMQKLLPDDQIWVICSLGNILSISEADSKNNGDPQLSTVARQIVDACPFLLQILCKATFSPKMFDTFKTYLQLCLKRKQEPGASLPGNLAPALSVVLEKLEGSAPAEMAKEAQELIRPLLPPTNSQVLPSIPSQGLSITKGPSLAKKRQFTGIAEGSNQTVPLNQTLPPTKLETNTDMDTSIPQTIDQRRTQPPLQRSGTNSANVQPDGPPRPLKRRKNDDADTQPSLLSRLQTSTPLTRIPLSQDARSHEKVHMPLVTQEVGDDPPRGGWSIKGAAKINTRTEPSRGATTGHSSFSLLDRLSGSSASVLAEEERNVGEQRRKRRGKQ